MAWLLDSNLWIDLTRSRSPRALKNFVSRYINDLQACLAEPIVFEVLRSATDAEALQLTQHFQSLPLLASPNNLWSSGVELARACRRVGLNAGSIDLLIATVAIHHGAELVTFDIDFQQIADVSDLRVKLLQRPSL
jgi:predicted nucleic acid-binding protein